MRRVWTRREHDQLHGTQDEHRFLECSGTQGSNSSGAPGGGGGENI